MFNIQARLWGEPMWRTISLPLPGSAATVRLAELQRNEAYRDVRVAPAQPSATLDLRV